MGLFSFFKKKKKVEEVDINLLQQKMYQDIFIKLQTYLPNNWKKVDFHCYHTSEYFGIKFYVLTENNEWVDCFNLLDKKLRTELFLTIDELVANVWNQLPKKNKWYVLNMIIDNHGHIDVSYDYADNEKENEDNLFAYLHNEEKEWDNKFKNLKNASIINVINSLEKVYKLKPATQNQIAQAETELKLNFAQEYKDYLLAFGLISVGNLELTGISEADYINVVSLTKQERELNPKVPESFYVVENACIDGIIIWQDSKGEIYQTRPNEEPQKIANSLADYILSRTK